MGYHRRYNRRYHHSRRKQQHDANEGLPPKPLKSLEGWILFITNLHEETSEEDIKGAFSEYGEVINIHLNLDRRTGFVKGYAVVEFKTKEEASSARECLNMSDLLGVTIKVDWCVVQY